MFGRNTVDLKCFWRKRGKDTGALSYSCLKPIMGELQVTGSTPVTPGTMRKLFLRCFWKHLTQEPSKGVSVELAPSGV